MRVLITGGTAFIGKKLAAMLREGVVAVGDGTPARSEWPDVRRLGTLLTLGHVELNLLTLGEFAVAGAGDSGVMDENVGASAGLLDEAKPLVGVEPFDGAGCHFTLLLGWGPFLWSRS
jgi:nucleoside-diphosphate-sugar epimerase